jgi:hypothetical protein
MRSTILTFVLLLWAVVPATAQDRSDEEDPPRAFQGLDTSEFPEYPDAPPGAPDARLRIVFDLVSRGQEIAAEPNQPFDVYLIAHDVQVALRGWEARVQIDERLTVVESQILADVNVGQWPEVYAAVKPEDCQSGETIVLAQMKMMLTEPATDVVLGLAPTSRPSAPTVETDLEPPTPVYLVCRPGKDVRPFDYCETCAVVNPREVEPERDEDSRPDAESLFDPVSGRHR